MTSTLPPRVVPGHRVVRSDREINAYLVGSAVKRALLALKSVAV